MLVRRTITVALLLVCILLAAQSTLSGQGGEVAHGSASVAASETSPVEDAPQRGPATTKAKVGQILRDVLILSLYGFPLSIAEGWVLADPTKAEKQPKTERSESPGDVASTTGDEAPAPADDWAAFVERLPRWLQKPQRGAAALVAGGCLTIAVVLAGAGAFALYYHLSGHPEEVSQVLPRFAYWLPFGLLGLVTDVPCEAFKWEDKRKRVLLRLILWWLPRVVIFAFVFNPPLLQNLDPTVTALAVLGIDGLLVAFFLWLYKARD
jgi:hypothetical protein